MCRSRYFRTVRADPGLPRPGWSSARLYRHPVARAAGAHQERGSLSRLSRRAWLSAHQALTAEQSQIYHQAMTGIRLADRMARLGTESAFEVLARARAIEDAGGKIIHLEIGEPDFPTAPHIVEAAVEALHAGATHYVPAPGIPPLRQAVAASLDRPGRIRGTRDPAAATPAANPTMFF